MSPSAQAYSRLPNYPYQSNFTSVSCRMPGYTYALPLLPRQSWRHADGTVPSRQLCQVFPSPLSNWFYPHQKVLTIQWYAPSNLNMVGVEWEMKWKMMEQLVWRCSLCLESCFSITRFCPSNFLNYSVLLFRLITNHKPHRKPPRWQAIFNLHHQTKTPQKL